MNPDDRLNQLEPLISESMAILDRHTALLRQHTGLMNQLVEITSHHSDTLSFILREQVDVKTRLGSVETRLEGVETRLEGLATRMEALEVNVGSKLDLILDKLNNSGK